MTFTETRLAGVFLVESDTFVDERGSFSRVWLPREFAAHGLDTRVAQGTMAFNHRRGTIRGLHYQVPPMSEVKLVRVTRGIVFDVAVDLRPDSPTFRQWIGVELSADNRHALYIPAGLAHGYQTLDDHTELFYLVSGDHSPPHQRGVRWDDSAFGIDWPIGAPTMINERDRTYPDFA